MRKRLDGTALEFLDRSLLNDQELRIYLADVERLNRWFGGTRAVLEAVQDVTRRRGLREDISLLDIGTGGADIPRALVRWGKRQGLAMHIAACDSDTQIAGIAASLCGGDRSIAVLGANALQLPFRAGHFDFVTCSLMVHHLAEQDVVSLLERLRGLPRCALIVSDLERSCLAYLGTWLATHLICRSRFTPRDGPVSVRRAFTLDELRSMSGRAGCGNMLWFRRPFFRAVGVLEV